jgi:hypothetical protein
MRARASTASKRGRAQKPIKYVKPVKPNETAIDHAVELIHRVCCLAGPADYISDTRMSAEGRWLRAAIIAHDTASLFNWLLEGLSYQGISDRVARAYMENHGGVTWDDIERGLNHRDDLCPKLGSYWRFSDCGFEKTSRTCNEPEHFDRCTLPTHDLRNGRLNQTAYSLYLFIRDVADGDLVAWIDDRLNNTETSSDQPGHELIAALRGIYGVSDKVLTMTLSVLLISAPLRGRRWFGVGTNLVAIDTLVHNFLWRTGILHRFGAEHLFGSACYQRGRCADVIHAVAHRINAREFNATFPQCFPRFVQYAIWRYCSQEGFDVCNGNRIDDRRPCNNIYCQLRSICDRRSMKRAVQ